MPGLELFLHNEFVGVVERSRRDKTRVELSVDNGYSNEGIVLSESFATLTGRRAPAGAVTNFLGGYVPEGNHREQMAARRHVDSSDLFALLSEFGGSRSIRAARQFSG
jgi:serine/threonine-protein kinase HipA